MMSGVFGAAEHSMGGTASLLAAGQDNRISAVVSMAPPAPNLSPNPLFSSCPAPSVSFAPCYQAAKLITVPTQIMSGSADTFAPLVGHAYYYTELTCPRELVAITDATHLHFMDILSNAARLSMIEKCARNRFDYYLKGDTSNYTCIFGTGAQNDLAAGALSALHSKIH